MVAFGNGAKRILNSLGLSASEKAEQQPQDDTVGKTLIVLIGASHYVAIFSAAEARSLPTEPVEGGMVDLRIFNAWKHGLNYGFAVPEDGVWVLEATLKEQLTELTADYDRVIFFSVFGGNHHQVLTLIGHERPYDVYMPEFSHVPLETDAEILSRSYVEQTLLEFVIGPYRDISIFLRAFPKFEFWHIQSPPPIGDDTFVRSNIDSWFVEQMKLNSDFPLTPRYVRQKVWQIHSDLYHREGQANGFELLPCPAGTRDAEGFLKPEFYSNDATHANPAYGELVLQQMEQIAKANIDSFKTFG
ncbi:MAG: hypothetical protein AAFY73_04315 [Pseudomonadota bacterium]